MDVGQSIERLGSARGLQGHLCRAEQALHALRSRTPPDGRCPIPDLRELDVLDTAISLHGYQLLQLSRPEYDRACQQAKCSAQAPTLHPPVSTAA
jgi:hypothetical protein